MKITVSMENRVINYEISEAENPTPEAVFSLLQQSSSLIATHTDLLTYFEYMRLCHHAWRRMKHADLNVKE